MAMMPVRAISWIPKGLSSISRGQDFLFVAGNFHHQRVGRDVDDLRAEDIHDLEDLAGDCFYRLSP